MGEPSVYYSMTNGGIIEGQMGVYPCSDLSSATYFGSGETRMQMRSSTSSGGFVE